MKITLTMFGDLRPYLPSGSQFNKCDLDVSKDEPLNKVLDQIKLPEDKVYMVMLNGEKINADDYNTTLLQKGDEITLFPPIKGG